MAVLEADLRLALQEQENNVLFQIKGKRFEFEQTIRQAHRRLKTGFFLRLWQRTYCLCLRHRGQNRAILFCPIKRARKILGTHSHYAHFLQYGDAADYAARLEQYRNALDKLK